MAEIFPRLFPPKSAADKFVSPAKQDLFAIRAAVHAGLRKGREGRGPSFIEVMNDTLVDFHIDGEVDNEEAERQLDSSKGGENDALPKLRERLVELGREGEIKKLEELVEAEVSAALA